MTTYDELKRRHWAGRAEAYAETFGLCCAHPIERLLDAARVSRGVMLLDVGTGAGAVAAAALRRGARVTAVDPTRTCGVSRADQLRMPRCSTGRCPTWTSRMRRSTPSSRTSF